MIFFHVSSYVKEGDCLTHNSKNNYSICKYISSTRINDLDDYNTLLAKLKEKDILQKTGRDHYKWSCEAIFENIRLMDYNDLPSRIWGVYVTKSLDKAMEFRKKYRSEDAGIFQIDIPEESVYDFDMNLFTEADEALRASSRENYDKAVELAHRYWKRIIIAESEIECIADVEIVVGKRVYPISSETTNSAQ